MLYRLLFPICTLFLQSMRLVCVNNTHQHSCNIGSCTRIPQKKRFDFCPYCLVSVSCDGSPSDGAHGTNSANGTNGAHGTNGTHGTHGTNGTNECSSAACSGNNNSIIIIMFISVTPSKTNVYMQHKIIITQTN